MALKDWKKVGANRWRKDRIFVQVYQGHWNSQSKKYWITGVGTLDSMYWISRKFFKNKAQALRYAKSYMKQN